VIPRAAMDPFYPPGSEDSKGRLMSRVHGESFRIESGRGGEVSGSTSSLEVST